MGTWWASAPRAAWEGDAALSAPILAEWREPWGDQRQELVFIGQDLDEATIRVALDTALLTEAEMANGPNAWASLTDPFHAWDLTTPDEADEDRGDNEKGREDDGDSDEEDGDAIY